jgi:flagellar basal-body rod modification protein FlgD
MAVTRTTTTGMNVADAIDGTVTQVVNNSQVLGKDEFLQLLVAQIKNQDPLNPTDSSQSIAQMAQFSALEQMQNLNSTMTKMYNYNTANTLVNNAVMIGKTVNAVTDAGSIVSGIINAVGVSDDGTTALYSVLGSDKKTTIIEAGNIISISQS